MARTGRFGRLPRTSPDISSTIISLLREFDNYRERNLVDAWQNGGSVEGKPVTDDMLLAFYRKRLGDLSPQDPAYDDTKNTLTQYEFAIANSKQELAYREGKVGDGAMVSFYRTWAAKLPQNSQAWRNLMGLAAQYSDRAKSASRSGRAARSNASYDTSKERASRKGLAYETITDAIVELAKREGILNTEDEDLTDLRVFEGDNGRLIALVNQFATAPEYAEYRSALTAYIRRYGDPNFSGRFDYDSWVATRQGKVSALRQALVLAQKNGKKADVKAILKEMGEESAVAGRVAIIDEMQEYEEGRLRWESVINDVTATPLEKYKATQDWSNELTDIHSRVAAQGGEGTGVVVGRMTNELRALAGEDINSPTLMEESRGKVASAHSSNEGSDAWSTSQSVKALTADVMNLLGGTHVIARVDGKGQVTANDGDAIWGVVPIEALSNESVTYVTAPGEGAVTLAAVDPNGNVVNQTFGTTGVLTGVVGVPVSVVAGTNPDIAGRPTAAADVKAGARTDVGSRFVLPDGTVIWSYFDAGGKQRYTTENPFVTEGVRTANGWEVPLPTMATGVTEYDPFSAVSAEFRDPDSADLHGSTVFLSGITAWLAAESAHRNGAVYFSNGDAIRTAMALESKGNEAAFIEKVSEVDQMRADFIAGSSDLQRSLQNAFRRGMPVASSTVVDTRPVTLDAEGNIVGGAEMAAIARAIQPARRGEDADRQEMASNRYAQMPSQPIPEWQQRARAMELLRPFGAPAGAGTMPIDRLRDYVRQRTGSVIEDMVRGEVVPYSGPALQNPPLPADLLPIVGAQPTPTLPQAINPPKPTPPPPVVQVGKETGDIQYKPYVPPKPPPPPPSTAGRPTAGSRPV